MLPTLKKLDSQFHELCHSLYIGGGGGNKNLSALSLSPSIVNIGKPNKKMFNCLQSKRGESKSEFEFQAEVSGALLFKFLCSLVKDTSRSSSLKHCAPRENKAVILSALARRRCSWTEDGFSASRPCIQPPSRENHKELQAVLHNWLVGWRRAQPRGKRSGQTE